MIHVKIDSMGSVKMYVDNENSVYMKVRIKGHGIETRYYENENKAILDALELETKHKDVKIVIKDDHTNNLLYRN